MVLYSRVIKIFDQFKEMENVIVANRMTDALGDVEYKVCTRDLFGSY